MEAILIINTGGTLNKVYNPVSGTLEIDKEGKALGALADKWYEKANLVNIIGKDSLEMTNHDRLELLATIHQAKEEKILIVHGTDTMDITAEYLADAEIEKKIVLTGAMVPYSIDPAEASANFASAWTALHFLESDGIYIAMHGHIASYVNLKKERDAGRFVLIS